MTNVLQTVVHYSMLLGPFVVPSCMFVATRRAIARAQKIKDKAINEEIPFAEFAAAELRAKRFAFATFILALLGAASLAATLLQTGPVRPKRDLRAGDDPDDIVDPAPALTSREPIPSHPKTPTELDTP